MIENQKNAPAYYGVRYAKLSFSLKIAEDTEIVKDKGSALRGGIGEMLLRAHCIADRNCQQCSFYDECMIQRIMYSRFGTDMPAGMHEGDSVGYVIYCGDKRTRYQAGDELRFELTLFGKTIVYFSQYLNAVHALGMNGLGAKRSRFYIQTVRNMYGQDILNNNQVFMERYKWQTIGDWIRYRKEKLHLCKQTDDSSRYFVSICIQSPVTIKYQGAFIDELSVEALSGSINRRVNILSCFEGLVSQVENEPAEVDSPVIIHQSTEECGVHRYSSRKNMKMRLYGLVGEFQMDQVSPEWLDKLLAIEILHIGKNTSFGFGRCCLKEVQGATGE